MSPSNFRKPEENINFLITLKFSNLISDEIQKRTRNIVYCSYVHGDEKRTLN